jgi:hypothetical protein
LRINHDKLTPVDAIFDQIAGNKSDEPFEFINSSFSDGVIIRRVPLLFDTEILVK